MDRHPNPNHDKFRFAYFNADGIKEQKYEVEEFLDESGVELMLVQESFLKPHIKFKIRNHEIYRNDRLQQIKGGTAIITRRNIQHYSYDLPPLNTLEASAVVVNTGLGEILLVSAYLSSDRQIDFTDFDTVFACFPRVLIAGDFNSKHPSWGSRITTPRGRKLRAYMDLRWYLTVGTDSPTHVPYNPAHRPDVLDICLLKNIPARLELKVQNDLSSDHLPVLAELGEPALHNLLGRRVLRKTN